MSGSCLCGDCLCPQCGNPEAAAEAVVEDWALRAVSESFAAANRAWSDPDNEE